MGWDSFGLPAEQYAIRTGTHPAITTQSKISITFDGSCILGFSYDWDRELLLAILLIINGLNGFLPSSMKKGLAYEAEMHGQLLSCVRDCAGQ